MVVNSTSRAAEAEDLILSPTTTFSPFYLCLLKMRTNSDGALPLTVSLTCTATQKTKIEGGTIGNVE